jgi:hypothetical protein
MYTLFIMIPFMGFAVWMYMRNAKTMKNWEANNAHFRAGEFAARAGLQLVEGDPMYNLATTQIATMAKNVKGSEYDAEYRLRMVGQTYGRPTEIAVEYTQRQPILSNTIYTTFFGGITMQTQAPTGRFEIYRRVSTLGRFTGMTADAMNDVHRIFDTANLPKRSFGDPLLDERYVVESDDPNLPNQLRAVMNTFGTMDFVHIIGQPGSVLFKSSQMMQNMVFMKTEEILYAVASVVATLEGRPMPAMVAMGLVPGGVGPAALPPPQQGVYSPVAVPQMPAPPYQGQVAHGHVPAPGHAPMQQGYGVQGAPPQAPGVPVAARQPRPS